MDPVSHMLFGGTLSEAADQPPPRGVTTALVLGSILPDIDIVLLRRGFDIYLSEHGAGTHAVSATPVEALVLAAGLRAIVPRSRFWPMLAAAWAGILGHLVWDLASGSDMKVLAPVSERVFGWHLITMGEPIVLAILLAGVALAWRWRPRRRAVAAWTLAALAVVLGGKAVSQSVARHRFAAAEKGVVSLFEIEAVKNSLFEWRAYDRAGDRVRAWQISAREVPPRLLFERRDDTVDPAVGASRELPVVRRFLGFAIIPFARVQQQPGGAVVLWSDLRMCTPTRCDLSFGGAFDAALSPLYQIVQIGAFRQTRPAR